MDDAKAILNQIRVVDLLNSGLIALGDTFRFKSANDFRGPEVNVLSDGNFEIVGDSVFSSPSSLASHISGGKSYNGWQVIARSSDGVSLDELRKRLTNLEL
jgi:hypothetical protein